METYRRLIDGCDDAELRVLSAFYRIGGLRLGEAFEARWEDVDWRAERFTVRSPKTERGGKDVELSRCFRNFDENWKRCVRKAAPTILSSSDAATNKAFTTRSKR